MTMSYEEYAALCAVGGRPITKGKDFARLPDETDAWNFGVLQPDHPGHLQLDKSQQAIIASAKAAMPEFRINGEWKGEQKKIILWDVFKQKTLIDCPAYAPLKGRMYPGNWQLTGSCVGVGSGDAATGIAATEVVVAHQPEEAVIVFWPYHYGRGRLASGIRGRGDGSTSEGQVEALQKDGVLRWDAAGPAGLPPFEDKGAGLQIGESQEMKWSDGAVVSQELLLTGRKNPVKTGAVCRGRDDAVAAITNGYWIMWCGNWGGLMKCPVVDGALLNRKSGSWSHNETCIAYWFHDTLGLLFGIKNQWGDAHGSDPGGLPTGSYWIKADDFDWQARGGSCIIVSNFDGFPARPDVFVDWNTLPV